MRVVTFDAGTQPWDQVAGQVVEGHGVGAWPVWRDATTNASFEDVLGRMCVEPVPNNPPNCRQLIQTPLPTFPKPKTILKIKLPDENLNFVRFRVGGELQHVVPVTIEYFSRPSYGTGGRPPKETLITSKSFELTGGSTIEYSYFCKPVTEVWITIEGSGHNWIDTVEFDQLAPSVWQRVGCLMRLAPPRCRWS